MSEYEKKMEIKIMRSLFEWIERTCLFPSSYNIITSLNDTVVIWEPVKWKRNWIGAHANGTLLSIDIECMRENYIQLHTNIHTSSHTFILILILIAHTSARTHYRSVTTKIVMILWTVSITKSFLRWHFYSSHSMQNDLFNLVVLFCALTQSLSTL